MATCFSLMRLNQSTITSSMAASSTPSETEPQPGYSHPWPARLYGDHRSASVRACEVDLTLLTAVQFLLQLHSSFLQRIEAVFDLLQLLHDLLLGDVVGLLLITHTVTANLVIDVYFLHVS